jgi:hypothetical protein
MVLRGPAGSAEVRSVDAAQEAMDVRMAVALGTMEEAMT